MLFQKQKPNLNSTPPKKGNNFLNYFREAVKKLFEKNNNDAKNNDAKNNILNTEQISFSEIVNRTYFGKQSAIHEDWQKNFDHFLHNLGLNSNELDDNIKKQLIQEQKNIGIYDYNLDPLSFTTGIHELSIELMIEDLQSYLGGKNNIFLVDVFSGTYSIPGVIIPFQNTHGLQGYLGIDLQDALRAETTQKAFLKAEEQGVNTCFLQTDAYSGLYLLPDQCVDVLLINGVDYTITSDAYMQKVISQAKRVLKQDGIISGIGNSFLHSPSRTQTYMQGYQIHQLGAHSYCLKK